MNFPIVSNKPATLFTVYFYVKYAFLIMIIIVGALSFFELSENIVLRSILYVISFIFLILAGAIALLPIVKHRDIGTLYLTDTYYSIVKDGLTDDVLWSAVSMVELAKVEEEHYSLKLNEIHLTLRLTNDQLIEIEECLISKDLL